MTNIHAFPCRCQPLPSGDVPGGRSPYNPSMPNKRIVLLAVLLAAASLPAAAQPVGVLIEGSWWRTGPTGTVQVSGLPTVPGVPGSLSIDLEGDLHVGKRSTFPAGVRLLRKSWRIEAEYLDTSWSADAVLTRDVVFQGVTYRASELVSSNAKLRDISGGFRFELPLSPYASVGLGVDADALRTEAAIRAVTSGVSAADTRNFVVPTGVVAVNVHDSSRHFWIDLKAGYVSYQGSRAEKGRAELGWAISQNVGLKVGWRLLDVTYVKERGAAPEDRVKVRLDGYTAGLFVAF